MSYNTIRNFFLFSFIFILSIQSTLTLECYKCDNCTDPSSCTCGNLVSVDSNSYCALLRETLPDDYTYEIKAVPKNLTHYWIYDPFFISVREKIVYNVPDERWLSESEEIVYGCQTDRCNRADLLQDLPRTGLSLMLPSHWLNQNLLRKMSKNSTLCRECPDEMVCGDDQHAVNMSQCSVQTCEGSCTIAEKYDKAETTQFCYQSSCVDGSSIAPLLIIGAVYYINTKQFDIVELNVLCNGDDCTSLQIFKDIKEQLEIDFDGIRPFLPVPDSSGHINLISIIFLMMILLLQIFIFY